MPDLTLSLTCLVAGVALFLIYLGMPKGNTK